MHAQRLDRAFSSGEASCSRRCSLSLPLRRLQSLPCECRQVSTPAMSRAASVVSSSSTLHRDAADAILEPEAELLSGDSPDSLSREFRAQVANLQNLERVKGKLHEAILDLPDPDAPDGDWRAEDGFSVSFYHMTSLPIYNYKSFGHVWAHKLSGRAAAFELRQCHVPTFLKH